MHYERVSVIVCVNLCVNFSLVAFFQPTLNIPHMHKEQCTVSMVLSRGMFRAETWLNRRLLIMVSYRIDIIGCWTTSKFWPVTIIIRPPLWKCARFKLHCSAMLILCLMYNFKDERSNRIYSVAQTNLNKQQRCVRIFSFTLLMIRRKCYFTELNLPIEALSRRRISDYRIFWILKEDITHSPLCRPKLHFDRYFCSLVWVAGAAHQLCVTHWIHTAE